MTTDTLAALFDALVAAAFGAAVALAQPAPTPAGTETMPVPPEIEERLGYPCPGGQPHVVTTDRATGKIIEIRCP